MNGPKLGALIEGVEQRDAVHVAIAPVTATEELRPGQDIGFVEGSLELVGPVNCIGIVDPFLKHGVRMGQRFWMFLYPQSIISLRHDWTHPAFVPSAVRDESEAWLRAYAVRLNHYEHDHQKAFDSLIDGLRRRNLYAYGSDLHGLWELDDAEDLKFHAERYLGIKIVWDEFTFSCSC